MDAATIQDNVRQIASRFATERRERQQRRTLDPQDFALLRDAGILLTAVPVEFGGVWKEPAVSIRPACEILRTLAHGDPSVALVSSMHPTVIGFWLIAQAPQQFEAAWKEQQRFVFDSARQGAWWGTIRRTKGCSARSKKVNSRAAAPSRGR
jgi:alkylation response protein AidB-like acyl-CoA dehydrogenase